MEFLKRFMRNVEDFPQRVAVSDCRGTELTYGELEQVSGRVYRYLRDHGIGREDLVCIRLPRGVEPVAAVLGVWRAGAAFVLVEEDLPADRIAFIRKDCGCALTLDRESWQAVMDGSPLADYEEAGDHDAAFAVYTSGSTGRPKGVLHEYGNIDLIYRSIYKYGDSLLKDTRFALIAPLNFVVSPIAIVCLLECGSTLFVVPGALAKNPPEMARIFVRNQMDALFCAPSALGFFRQIPTLKAAFIGSEPARGIWSEDPGFEIYNGYCMSECAFFPMIAKLDAPNDIAPVGQPCFDIDIRLCDEDGMPVPDVMEGEICFPAAYVRGYINLPEETARTFASGICHTKDLGRRLPNGDYVVVGRIDDMIKINGNRVEPAEIEEAFRRVTGMQQVIAKGFAEGDSAFLCLYYADDVDLDEEQTRSALAETLPDYMIPSHFIKLEALPRTQSGKLSRSLLPRPEAEEGRKVYTAPANPTEKLLCDSMAEILELSRVGADEDFYHLGGSSINAMKLVAACPLAGLDTGMIYMGRTAQGIAAIYQEAGVPATADGPAPDNTNRKYPLTQTQLGVYVECEQRRGEAAYNNPYLLRFPADTSVEKLRSAAEAALKAHPGIFSQIVTGDDGMPAMQCRPAGPEETICMVSHVTQAQFDELRNTLLRPFDIRKDRLFRLEIYVTEGAVYLFTDIHHIVYDGTSAHILLEDMLRAWKGDLPETEIYTAYQVALEEQAARETTLYKRCRNWYLEEFKDLETVALPEGDVKGKEITYGQIKRELDLDPEKLRAFCESNKLTENVVTTAAFGLLLSAYTRTDGPAFATIYNGRKDMRTDRTVTMLVKTLPVLCRTGSGPIIGDYLNAVKEQMLGAMANDLYSFPEASAELGISSDVLFTWQDQMYDDPALSGLGAVREDLPFNATGKPLSVELFLSRGRLVLDVQFHKNRYSEAYVQRLAGCYEMILRDMLGFGMDIKYTADGPATEPRISEIRLVSEEEEKAILSLSRGEAPDYDRTRTWIDLFLDRAKKHPDRTAVVDSESSISYGELNRASDAVATWLLAHGTKAEDFIAIEMDRVKEFVIAVLGVHKAGAAYMPIDPEYPKDRIDYMMEDSGAKIVLTRETVIDVLDRDSVSESADTAGPAFAPEPVNLAGPEGAAYMIYTSGSTGKPKGAVNTHRALLNYTQHFLKEFEIREEDRISHHTTWSFDAHIRDLFTAMAGGAALYIMPEEIRREPEEIVRFLEENCISGGSYATAMGQLLLSEYDLKQRYISVIGEALKGIRAGRCRVFNLYGPTECADVATEYELEEDKEYGMVPIGRPISGVSIFIVDRSGNLLPRDAAGEICIAGLSVGRGYWKQEALTAEKFVDCPYLPGQKMYRTGDLGRWGEDGNLVFLGRIDTQVKLRGYRIELGEVEAAAISFGAVKEAAAEVRDERLVLYYTADQERDSAVDQGTDRAAEEIPATDGTSPKADTAAEVDLRAFLAKSLPDYMVPSAFVLLDEMPMTPSGKIDRKALPDPEFSGGEEIIAPETETEGSILDMAAGLLGTDGFGVTSDLISMGLSSIGAMRLAAEIDGRFGVRVPVSEIIGDPRIRAIAAVVETAGAGEHQTLTAYEKRDLYPITENQRGVFIDWQTHQGTTQYNIPSVTAYEHTDGEVLAEAVRRTIDAHSYLKVRFEYAEGDLMQRRRDEEEALVTVEKLAEAPDAAFFQSRIRPFDLLEDRLYRAEVHTCGDTSWLFMDIHHIIYDGFSRLVFNRGLKEAMEGKPVKAESLTAFDYALYESERAESEAYREAESYFDALVSGATAARLPDSERADGRPVGYVTVYAEAEKIDAFCRENSVTPSSFLQAAFAEALTRITREEKVMYTTVSSGRAADPTLQGCVGMFVKTLPVTGIESGEMTAEEYVRAMHEQLNASYSMDLYPYTKVVERHQLRADMQFVYQEGMAADAAWAGQDGLALDQTKLPLAVETWRENDRYVINIEYDGNRYGAEDMLRFGKAIKNAVESLATETRVRDIRLVSEEEEKAVLALSRGEELDYDRTRTWIDLFLDCAKKHPDRTAVVDSESSISYGELDRASDAVAAWLLAQGTQAEDFIAVEMGRAKEFVIAVLGIHKAGAAYMPIDPEYPKDRIDYMLEDSGVKIVLTWETVVDVLARDSVSEPTDPARPTFAPEPVNLTRPEGAAYMIYTSGSTGKPKGVMISHKAMLNLIHFIRYRCRITENSRIACFFNFSFDGSVMDLYPALTVGGAVFIVPERERHDLNEMRRYLRENSITGGAYPTRFGELLSGGEMLDLDFFSLGGEAMTMVPKVRGRVYNAYGPTEFTVCGSYYELDKTREYRTIPIGRPLTNCHAFVVDMRGELVPQGMAGELCLAGPQIAEGYWKQKELTAEKFVDCPWLPEQKMYRTGDLVRYDEEGQLEYLGRIDTQIKLRGFRIELGEIESRAMGYEGIRAVACEVRKENLVLYYTSEISYEDEIDEGLLKDYLSRTLADYMIPSVYMRLEEMPMTPNGKIDRKALPDPEISGGEEIITPETEAERSLFDMAADLLGTEDFGVTSDLVSLGLSSIGAMRLAAEIHRRLGVRVPVLEIVRNPKIRTIAAAIETAGAGEHQTLTAYEKRDLYPITENQRGLFIDWQTHQETTQYNIPSVTAYEHTDGEVLAEAVRRTIDAHSYLKARFEYAKGDVMQRRRDEEEALVSVERLEKAPDTAFFQSRIRPFDLLEDRLYRAEVYTCGDNSWLFLDIHHIIYDGFSRLVFNRDLKEALERKPVKAEDFTAFDYALYESDRAESEAYREAEGYFDALVRGATAARLPDSEKADGRPVGYVMVHAGAEKIDAFLRENSVTPSSFLQAAFAEALTRITREEKVMYTTVSSGRAVDPTLQGCVGMFVKTLPVTGIESGELTAEEYVRAMHEQLNASYSMDLYPYTKIVEEHQLRADMQFIYQEGMAADAARARQNGLTLDQAKLPVTVQAWREDDRYAIGIEYDGRRYGSEDMIRFGKAIKNAAESLATEPRVRDIRLVAEEEEKAILSLSTGEILSYDRTETWVDLFREKAKQYPDKIAVIDNESSISYGKLDRASDAVASYLLGQGTQAEDFIAIEMDRVKEFVIAVLGIHKAGAAYMPIDPAYPKDRIDYMLEDSGAKIVLTRETVIDVLARDSVSGSADPARPAFAQEPVNLARPEGAACMIYTSGSTGRPKGAVNTHAALCNYVRHFAQRLEITPEDRISHHITWSFVAHMMDLYSALAGGAALYIMPEEIRREPEEIARFLEENRISGGTYATAMGRLLLSECDLNQRYIALTGETLKGIRVCRPGIFNLYGPTECADNVTEYELEEGREYGMVPIGRPISNVSIFILDQYGNLLPRGAAGEICIAGVTVGRGYWRQEELTAEKFVDCPYLPGQRMFRTGDLGRWGEDGNLVFLGRIDTQVKLRGYRIELGEVEATALSRGLVKQAAAEVRDDRLVLYYTLDQAMDGSVAGAAGDLSAFCDTINQEIDGTTEEIPATDETSTKAGTAAEDDLRAFLARSLPDYMVPSAYVLLDEMPMTPSGKIDRKALPEPEIVSGTVYVEPATETERIIAETMQRVLGTDDPIGAEDSFRALGGDSIKAIRMVSLLRDRSIQVTVADIMKGSTVREVAGRAVTESASDISQEPFEGYVRDNTNVSLFKNMGLPEPWHFNTALLFSLASRADVQILQKAWNALVYQHDMLRAVMREGSIFIRSARAIVEIEEYAAENEAEITGICSRILSHIRMSEALVRAALIHSPDSDYFFLAPHHLVTDLFSNQIIWSDLETAYGQAVAGEEIRLPAKTSSYRDYAELQWRYRDSDELRRELPYWIAVLKKIETLPDPRGRKPVGILTGALDEGDTKRLIRASSDAKGAEINNILLTAVGAAYRKLTGEESVSVQVAGHGREDMGEPLAMDRTVGWIASRYPVILEGLKGEARHDLRLVRETMRRVPNKGVGFDILRHLKGEGGSLIQSEKAQMIYFNYYGNLDGWVSTDSSFFRPSHIDTGPNYSEKNGLDSEFSITCDVMNGVFQLSLEYNAGLNSAEEMQGFLDDILSEIRSITECSVGEHIREERP